MLHLGTKGYFQAREILVFFYSFTKCKTCASHGAGSIISSIWTLNPCKHLESSLVFIGPLAAITRISFYFMAFFHFYIDFYIERGKIIRRCKALCGTGKCSKNLSSEQLNTTNEQYYYLQQNIRSC